MSKRALGVGIALALFVALPGVASAEVFQGSALGQVTGQTPVRGGVKLEITATGTATRIGQFTRTEVLTLNPETGSFYGNVSFTNGAGDTLTGFVTGAFVSAGTATGTYEWTSGTGRFRNPVGTARFVVTSTDGVHFTAEFKGLLTLVRTAP